MTAGDNVALADLNFAGAGEGWARDQITWSPDNRLLPLAPT
jgi:hypothetical protein